MSEDGGLKILIDGLASFCVIPSIGFNLLVIAFGFVEDLELFWVIA